MPKTAHWTIRTTRSNEKRNARFKEVCLATGSQKWQVRGVALLQTRQAGLQVVELVDQ